MFGLTELGLAYAARRSSAVFVLPFILFAEFLVNEIIPASSARFPCLNIQSRDRSPPRFFGFNLIKHQPEIWVESILSTI